MTVGGVGFQLTSYVIGAERGYLSRDDAADRVLGILHVLNDQPQGPERVGTIGYKGFFYHFLGIDGNRKQNFDFVATEGINEALNSVELSTIDTALAIAGIITARQYFSEDTAKDTEIRAVADLIIDRVDWRFMFDDERFTNTRQFFLGWKPNENRDDDSGRRGRFKLDDDSGNPSGQYASKSVGDQEIPATLDYYTDEALLIALLAMASPNPDHWVGIDVWDAIIRDDDGGDFVKTFPGSLFTFQFLSVWLDTEQLGQDNHATKPVDFFVNTQKAIQSTMDYAALNPEGHTTLNENRWGLSAVEGPYDAYFADAASSAALGDYGEVYGAVSAVLDAELGTGDGIIYFRLDVAHNDHTVRLYDGGNQAMTFDLDETGNYTVSVRYSNDNYGPLEVVSVSIDDELLGQFTAQDTGDGGDGWYVFVTDAISNRVLEPGTHEILVSISGGDGGGIEIDCITLEARPVMRPLEVGTVTNYGAGSAVMHNPDAAVAALWSNVIEDLNQDGTPDLLHPRFGLADAFNFDISDAVIPGAVHCDERRVLRCSGPWVNYTGFSINHGPMLILIDNYLEDSFIPKLFMSYPPICKALRTLFPADVRNCAVSLDEAVLILKILAGISPKYLTMNVHITDCSEDGKLGIEDAICILRRIAGFDL